MRKVAVAVVWGSLACGSLASAFEPVVRPGDTWRYLDSAGAPADTWTELGFDASGWKEGKGILGYGDSGLGTVLGFGADPEKKNITAWFRKGFSIGAGTFPDLMRVRLIRDDGVVVYLNGIELFRENMPPGFVDAKTGAVSAVGNADERAWHEFTFPAEGLVAGENVLAAEVHQNGGHSSDLSFDLSFEVSFSEAGDSEGAEGLKKVEPVAIFDPAAVAAAGRMQWAVTGRRLLETALESYGSGDLQSAARRYYASRWAGVFARRGAGLDAGLKSFLLGDALAPVSQEFFDLLSPFDDQDQVFKIVGELYAGDPAGFRAQPRLALAIALVYDQKPPSGWPHHQVSTSVLPRKLPGALEAFQFWAGSDLRGVTLHPFGSLTLEELKYVVDTPAPLAELLAAQEERLRLTRIGEQYSGINYVHSRARSNVYNWPHESYTLPEIKRLGGICVDQAYYATQVAKAHGVPSMVVSGTGQSGNHAWVGFLDRNGRWDFDVGRYPESKFVTGKTYDPQTWRQPTDHDLAFLTERFRSSSGYRVSRIHALFAQEYLVRREFDAAVKACESAISSEPRNLVAWETLIQAKRAKAPEEDLVIIYSDGAKAFSRYADLEAGFLRRTSASLEAQGDTEEAEKLRRRIISRNRRERPDLAIEEAKEELEDILKDGTPDDQLALYKSQLNRFKDAGLIAFYKIAGPFLDHQVKAGNPEVAREALKYTRRRMESEGGSQLEENLEKWEERLGER